MRKNVCHHSLEDVTQVGSTDIFVQVTKSIWERVQKCQSPRMGHCRMLYFFISGSPKAQNRSSTLKECGGGHFVKKKRSQQEPENREDLRIKRQKSENQIFYPIPGWGGVR